MVVYLCRGSDCRKDKLPRKLLEARLPGLEVVTVGCQKVCKSPVVGVDRGGGPRWFRKVKGDKTLEALQRYVETGKPPEPLAEREAKKRAGRLRS